MVTATVHANRKKYISHLANKSFTVFLEKKILFIFELIMLEIKM